MANVLILFSLSQEPLRWPARNFPAGHFPQVRSVFATTSQIWIGSRQAMMSGVIWSSMKAQLQLALLQPLQPQQVRRGRLMQRIDRRVEIAVFLLQPGKFGLQLTLVFVGHEIC